MKTYITNTTTTYSENEVYVDLYGRTEERELNKIRVTGFEPYFFVEESVARDINPTLHEDIDEVHPDADETSLKGVELGKVVASHPGAVSDLRENYDRTWEADVRFTNRLRIDGGVVTGVKTPPATQKIELSEIEPVDMEVEERRVTFDIEVDDRGAFPEDGEKRILSIACHDSYTGEMAVFLDTGGRTLEEALPRVAEERESPDGIDSLFYEPTEKKMLIRFLEWFNDVDPDLLAGWNSMGFEVPSPLFRRKIGEKYEVAYEEMVERTNPNG